MRKIRISAISYLNTSPFVYGLKHSAMDKDIEMKYDTPALCAERLLSGDADLGIVPVAVIPQIKNAEIVSDYCIGATNIVRSVVICSNSPIHEVEELYLDGDSRTSALLAQILLKHYWKHSPNVKRLQTQKSINPASSNIAYVLIGDKVFDYEGKFKFVYDLALTWKEYTDLPFVFAAWVSTKPLPPEFVSKFNSALKFGLEHIREAIEEHPCKIDKQEAYDYLTKNISYNFDEAKHKALNEYWNLASGITNII